MPVLDADALDRDPQGAAALRGIFDAQAPARPSEPLGAAALLEAAQACLRRSAILASLRGDALPDTAHDTPIFLDRSPA